ncbi:phosphotransferase family protein [Paenibacillus hexagrammi]|uniref:Aminoglycoside phosphotransferase family protein n=1 Tax=Paenibacillus hexagrammi TaxID=2908839 RepID=A0ABY3SDR7_9BACL|nr:phosphotransferase [Paenibacillus sp. YPD9-1]UJF31336.1 aminoglycoside phosphotransferase family protein [Paenibacillus sp. YPD9-1]
MLNLHTYVLPDGRLNPSKISKQELLYKGNNGKFVERFYVNESQSYIFKPLTNVDRMGSEMWVFEHIMPSLPQVYPKILASSSDSDPDRYWIIMEDLGVLDHTHDRETILSIVTAIAKWHATPTESLNHAPLAGPKPSVSKMKEELLTAKQKDIELLIDQLPYAAPSINIVISAMKRYAESDEMVLCHGDLHAGNFARQADRVVVLDWEHTHVNTRFWDLFHALDISHPTWARHSSAPFRKEAIDVYIDHVQSFTGKRLDRQAFWQEYITIASIFSLWMLLLIKNDLISNTDKWPKVALEQQFQETMRTLMECAAAL